ncbi:MAG TPA: trypsin-like peptidase domain-containing protein [Chloroflexota bacterium]|nr:trypsin-like peptidase domain-containing protein [Chloroflexota bacterium]
MAMAIDSALGLDALSGALADLAQQLRPSVVSVHLPGRGGGAGVIWDADGLVVTNAHVARDARLEVVLDGGRRLPAVLVARDPAHDLAALRVAASGLPAAPSGDSTALRVGELVFAMGHPLGEPHAVSLGIVTSAGHGARVGDERLPDVVRADLALYPGNSGGPLADARGRVIGINSMVVPPRLALAVPSATVARFLAPGSRARLGVRTQRVALPPPLAHRLGLRQEYGLMVVDVLAGEPAAGAGLLPGDVLLAAGGWPLETPSALADAVDAVGERLLRLEILRGGGVRVVEVTPRSAG